MDKLPVHRAKEVTTVLQQLDMVRIFNVGYFPEGNPIEAVFSKVKSIFCRRRSNCLINKVGFNMDREIENAFQQITGEHCGACARKSYLLLQRGA